VISVVSIAKSVDSRFQPHVVRHSHRLSLFYWTLSMTSLGKEVVFDAMKLRQGHRQTQAGAQEHIKPIFSVAKHEIGRRE
jgi:hypothetical protein